MEKLTMTVPEKDEKQTRDKPNETLSQEKQEVIVEVVHIPYEQHGIFLEEYPPGKRLKLMKGESSTPQIKTAKENEEEEEEHTSIWAAF